MLLIGRLREGAHTISMHSFICFPGPHIVAMKVTPPATTVKWAMYPGNLVKVEMVPDFGWLGAISGPFIPKPTGGSIPPTISTMWVGCLIAFIGVAIS